MKKIGIIFSFVIGLVLTPAVLAQESGTATFVFEADNNTAVSGETINVDVYVDSENTEVNAVDLRLNYPTDSFAFEQYNTNESDYEISAEETVDESDGLIKIVRGTIEPKDNRSYVGAFSFRALQNVSIAELDYSPKSAVMSTDNENILEDSTVKTVKVEDNQTPEEESELSFFDRLKQWNINFWNAIFSFFSGLFGGN